MGLPILTNSGVGDVDAILKESNVGVIVEDFSPEAFVRGWKGIQDLLSDPTIATRCRSVATTRLSVKTAVDHYEHVYRDLGIAGKDPSAPPIR